MKDPVIILIIIIIVLAVLLLWGTIVGLVMRRQQDELKKAREEAGQAETIRKRFLANISQELLAPLNTIIGMGEMILREDAKDVPASYRNAVTAYDLDIRRASGALLGMVGSLIEMSKSEAEGMKLSEEGYDTAEMLRSITGMIRLSCGGKALEFKVNVDELLPKRLCGDIGKIRQILLSILTNAVNHTDIGSVELEVAVEEIRDMNCDIRIRVTDTGIGMTKEELKRLNSIIEGPDEEKTAVVFAEGSGLGIAAVFVSLMGGKLDCKSVYGEGTEFTALIPQKIADATPIGEFTDKEAVMDGGVYVPQFVAPDSDILVVDEDRMNLTVIRGLLKATGVFVTTVSGGEECLEKLRDKKYDVVFIGHLTKEPDGWKLIERIRETDKELPVYVLTTNMGGSEEQYRSRGFTGRLIKPIDSMVLERTIMRHLPEAIMQKKEGEPG